MGLGERVWLRHFEPGLNVGWSLTAKLWAGIVLWDTLFQLRAYYRPLARKASDVDRLYDTYNDQLEELLAQPTSTGLAGFVAFLQAGKALHGLVDSAATSFTQLAGRTLPRNSFRRVLLSGDVYLRFDEFASGDLIRLLNNRGLGVIIEPLSLLAEYMAEERLGELLGLPRDPKTNLILKRGMATVRRGLHSRVRVLHPWLPSTDLKSLLAASRAVLDQHPFGEAPITIGSVLHHWHTRACDGVVTISPWGCGPALVSESLLRHHEEIPTLFIYADGSPLDERKIDAFAFQLRRMPSRV
jgi:predicted nucleotide-binding protein (sugar kinase/HSP70/actin superfamily)